MAIKPIDEMTAALAGKGEETQLASAPDPGAERSDMMDIMSEKYFGKSYDKLTPKEIELLEENWDELISQREQPEGIMQLASAEDNIQHIKILSAIEWFRDTYGQEALDTTDLGSIIDAYLNADMEGFN